MVGAFFGAILTTNVFACSGIDEPDLFLPSDGGTGTKDSGKADSSTRDSGVPDSGKILTGGTVQCSGGPCDIDSNQVCCYSNSVQSGACELAANCSGDQEFPIPCDSTDDCTELGKPDTLCCAQADQSGAVTNIECRAPSNCQASNGQTNLCDPAAANPCPNGGTCSPSTQSLPGYYLCVM
jgi:hypothetical protein